MHIDRLFDILPFAHEKYHKEIALAGKRNGKWMTYSSAEYIEYANQVSAALMHLGIEKGDNILNISVNRPEWNFVDMGVLQLGAVHIPVYPTINVEDLENIVEETEAKVAVISGKFLIKTMKEFQAKYPTLKYIITLDNSKEVMTFTELIELGKEHMDQEKIDTAKANVHSSDLASILYTSGTTNAPKGVMLSHKNLLTIVKIVVDTIKLHTHMTNLSYLPLSHSYERMVNYTGQFLGISMYYNENLANILSNFKSVKPNILVTVPLLIEKVYAGIMEKGETLTGIQKIVFKWAIKVGSKFELGKEDTYSWWYKKQLDLANKLVFVKWREALGGNMNKIIVGGASLQREIYNIFWAARIPVFEGYGLTEASPLVSYNTEDFNKPGSLGKTLFNVITRISEDGELLVKGGSVMMGYYKHPELTAKAIDKDGWLHTGDRAELDENGYLTVTGRMKDAFKTYAGNYVFPESIENKLKLSPFIDQILVTGENQRYLIGIVIPNFDYIKKWAKSHNVSYDHITELVENKELKEAMLQSFKHYNLSAKEGQKILDICILPDAWTIENSEITPSMKIRRAKLLAQYDVLIKGMFEGNKLKIRL
jgi:long-chain acyl-CoA synthetase